jgi:hypothetical protein
MQHCKHGEFNPLDILATAAALKQVDKPEKCPKQKIVIVKPKDGVKILNENESPSSSGNDKSLTAKKPIGLIKTTSFIEDGVKKIKLTISPEHCLNTHYPHSFVQASFVLNYFVCPGSFVLPQGYFYH